MPLDAWLTVAILVAVFAALLATKLPPATVFLGALTLSVTFDLAPLDRSLAGFANPGVLTIGALFMVAAGMYTTGAISLLSEKFIGRIVMANLITNTASAVFLFPIALSIADQLSVNFMPFAIALMTGTVGAAITPAAYQTNLMVYGPGEYAFMDFVKIGVPLTVVVGVITIWLAPIFFPF